MMKRGMKILHTAFFGALIVCALLYLLGGNFPAFCGWFVAACWFAVAMVFASNAETEARSMRDRIIKISEENAQLRSRIRELESEGINDGKQSC